LFSKQREDRIIAFMSGADPEEELFRGRNQVAARIRQEFEELGYDEVIVDVYGN
jgi:hypothetical protein